MNDFTKNTKHTIEVIVAGQYCGVSKNDVVEKFGSAPDWFEGLSCTYFEDLKPLLDWILTNTAYKLVSVSENGHYISYWFAN